MPKVETFDRILVLKGATDVFHNKGYNATSMQDLVDATGLNRSSIYNSFGGKKDLFMYCLKAYQDSYYEKIFKKLDKAQNPLRALELLLELYLKDILEDTKNKGCMITNCASEMANQDPLIANFLNSNQNGFLEFLGNLVESGQAEGLINKKRTPRDYALYLFSAIQGFRTAGILLSNKNDLEVISKMIIQTLI